MSNSKGDKQKCKCGFKRRGSNHDEGSHHKDWEVGKRKTVFQNLMGLTRRRV